MAHNGGRACVDVDLPSSTYQAPFLNILKSCNGWFTSTAGFVTDWRTLLDARGYPTAMPGGGAIWQLPQVWMWGQAGDTWVLDWPGTANVFLDTVPGWSSPIYTINSINANRTEYALSATPVYGTFPDGTPYPCALTRLNISSMSANTFAGGSIRLYLKNGSPSGPDDETRLNNGEIFRPKFTSIVGKFGVVRFMPWDVSEQNTVGYVGKWADRVTPDFVTYWNSQLPTVRSQFYAGSSSGTNAISVAQPPNAISSWTQGQKIQFVLTNPLNWVYPAGVTIGNPTIFHSIAHGLSNGDIIQTTPGDFTGPNWRYIASPSNENEYKFLTVTVIDADHFSVPFNSIQLGTQQASFTGFIGPSSTVLTASAVTGIGLGGGQVLSGAGVAANTVIVSQASGTPGGAGTYNLNGNAQSVSSEAMTSVSFGAQQAGFTGSISGSVLTASSVSGTLAVGQVVLGTSVATNTQIVSLTVSTTGGAGTYNLTNSQTVSTEAMASFVGGPNLQQASFTGVISSVVLTASTVSGTLAVGQAIFGAGVAADTQIISLGTGTGGAGTYNLSGSAQSVSSEAMTSTQVLLYTKQVTLVVGSLTPVPCCGAVYCANFSPNFQWQTGRLQPLTANDYIDGTYDSVLNVVMLDSYPASVVTGFSSFPTGMPIEVLIDFCKRNGNHLWINVRASVDDNYITQLATYVKANFTDICPGQLAMFEPDNEIWNSGVKAWYSARANVEINNPYFHPYYGKRCNHLFTLLQSVFGVGGPFRVMFGMANTFVFGTPGNNPFVTDRALDFQYFGVNISSISIANPAVITTSSAHGYSAGTLVCLQNQGGSLPAPFKDSTDGGKPNISTYYVVSPTSTTLQLANTPGGTPISTLGGSYTAGTNPQIARPPVLDCTIIHAPYFNSAIQYGTTANYPSTSPPVGGLADQIWNYTQGGSGPQNAFNYMQQSILHPSLDQTDFPSALYIDQLLGTVVPFWHLVASVLPGVEVHQYEGGVDFSFGMERGFPVTAPTSGQTVTVANVRSFISDFLKSQQFADIITFMFNGAYNLGDRFPAQFTVEGPQQVGGYWGLYKLNTDSNGFVDAPVPLAYKALRIFNDPLPPFIPITPGSQFGNRGHIHYRTDWIASR